MATMASPKAKAMPTWPMASPPNTTAPQPISTSTSVPMNSATSLFIPIPRKTSHAGSNHPGIQAFLRQLATCKRCLPDSTGFSGRGAGGGDGAAHRIDIGQGDFIFPLDGRAAHADMGIAEGHAAPDGVERREVHFVHPRRLPHLADI